MAIGEAIRHDSENIATTPLDRAGLDGLNRDIPRAGAYEKTLARFKNDVFPRLGRRPIAEIDAPEVLEGTSPRSPSPPN